MSVAHYATEKTSKKMRDKGKKTLRCDTEEITES